MMAADRVILVVNANASAGNNLKELIEFMDTPRVCTAAPYDWRERLGEQRLEALFLGSDLAEAEVEQLMQDVAERDPNVPIVMMTPDKPV